MKQLSLILSVFLFISLTNNVFGQANSGGPRNGTTTTTTTNKDGKDKKKNGPKRDIPFTHSLQLYVGYGAGHFPGVNFNTQNPGIFTARFGYRNNLISTSVGYHHFLGDRNPTFLPDTSRSFARSFNAGFLNFELNVEEAMAYILGRPGRKIAKMDGRPIIGVKMQFNQKAELYRGTLDEFELRAYTGFTIRYRIDDLRQARAAICLRVQGGYRFGGDGAITRKSERLHNWRPDEFPLVTSSHSIFFEVSIGFRYMFYPWR